MRLLLLQDAYQVLLIARLEILKLRLKILIIEACKVLFIFRSCVVLGARRSSSLRMTTDILSRRTPPDVLNIITVDMLTLGISGAGILTTLTLSNTLEAKLVAYYSRWNLLYQMRVLVPQRLWRWTFRFVQSWLSNTTCSLDIR